MPPPTPTSTSPARIWVSRIAAARTPDAQTLLTVSEETSLGMPALICAWREGIWPWPAWSTWPMTTCWTSSGATSARSRAALIAVPPSSVASSVDRPPPSFPIGVRAVPRMTVLGISTSPGRRYAGCGVYGAALSARDRYHRLPARHAGRHRGRRDLRGRGRRPRHERRRAAGARGRRGGPELLPPRRRRPRRRQAVAARRARRARPLRRRAGADRRRGGAAARGRAGRARAVLGAAPSRRGRHRGGAGRGHRDGRVPLRPLPAATRGRARRAGGPRRLGPPRRGRDRRDRGGRRRGGQRLPR